MSEKFNTTIEKSSEEKAVLEAIEIMRGAEIKLLEKDNTDLERDIERLSGVLNEFLEKNGAHQFEKWQDKMREIVQHNPSLLIRRENPETLLKSIGMKAPLNMGFAADEQHSEEAYPNAAELGTDLNGLRVPATLGFGSLGKGALIFMVGFKPGENIQVEHLPKGKFEHLKDPDRSRIRMVKGDVPYENIKFILCRFPYHLFPKDQMTEKELKLNEDLENKKIKNLPPITRLYSINQ